jgi:hypothetical protein
MARDVEQEARHKVLVLEAFDALFNRRDFEAAERYWSPGYVQHSAGIGRGRCRGTLGRHAGRGDAVESKSGLPMFGDRFPGE